jgi:DNA-binding NarL/FixJ family response regulator
MVSEKQSSRPNGRASRSAPGRSEASNLSGMRVFVVEDEFLLSMQIEEELLSRGCSMIGPFSKLADAIAAAPRHQFDLALLDINLNGEMVYPLADELMRRRIPIVMVSGYGTSNIPERFRATPRVPKPYDPKVLFETIRQALANG